MTLPTKENFKFGVFLGGKKRKTLTAILVFNYQEVLSITCLL